MRLPQRLIAGTIAALFFTAALAQLHVGAELRGAYIGDDRMVMPGSAASVTGELSQRMNWKTEISWYLPRSGNRNGYEGGPHALAYGDTNQRVVDGRYRDGMMGAAFGVQGRFSRRSTERGMDWELMLAVDDRTRWSSGTTRHVYTGEVREWQGRTHRFLLGLRTGAGYRVPLGNGQLRLGAWTSMCAVDFEKYPSERYLMLPVMGATASYHVGIAQ